MRLRHAANGCPFIHTLQHVSVDVACIGNIVWLKSGPSLITCAVLRSVAYCCVENYPRRGEFLCDTHQNWCRSRDQSEGYPKLFGDHNRHDIDIISTASGELDIEGKMHPGGNPNPIYVSTLDYILGARCEKHTLICKQKRSLPISFSAGLFTIS